MMTYLDVHNKHQRPLMVCYVVFDFHVEHIFDDNLQKKVRNQWSPTDFIHQSLFTSAEPNYTLFIIINRKHRKPSLLKVLN